MKKPYAIVWAETAENDLYRIIKYIVTDYPSRAEKLFQKIKRQASRLYHTPTRGRIIPELQVQGVLQYRELVIPPWRVIYRISGHSDLVLTVLDSRRNIEDILLERLLNLE